MENTHYASWFFGYLIAICIAGAIHSFSYYIFFYKTSPLLQKVGFYTCVTLIILNVLYLLLRNVHIYVFIDFILALSIGIGFLLFAGAVFYCICLSPFLLVSTKEQYYHFAPYIRYLSLFLVLISIVFSFYNSFKTPILKTITLPIKNLTQELKVIQISDLHISTLSSAKEIQKIISIVNAQNPDIIVLTGDIVDAKSSFILDKINLLRNLSAHYGIYYVLGNHEYYFDTQNILNLLKDNKFIILNNSSSTLFDSNHQPLINIIGITDFEGDRLHFLQPDPKNAILKRNPNIPSIFLSHQPKVIKMIQNQRIDLVLSGHTHGGQIFPFNFLVPLQQPYVKGLHQFEKGSFIYVSQGTGTWGPPMRLGTQSEITLFTLKPQK